MIQDHEILERKYEKIRLDLEVGALREEEALSKIENLNTILEQKENFLTLLADEQKRYNADVNKYIYETKAKKYMPFLYALLLMMNSSDNNENIVMRAFAGYGGGVLLENSGWGISDVTSWMIYGKWNFKTP